MYPFERFTERAKKVLTLAQEEAERSHHTYIGTEHLLLGLLREGEGLAARVLENLGVEIGKVREAIESVLGRNERIIIQQIIPTSRVKKVIEISFEEARQMGHNYVGTEHLLLGLLIEGEGIAAHVLEDLGATLDKVRAEVQRLLAGGHDLSRGRPSPSLADDTATSLGAARELAGLEGAENVGPEHLLLALAAPGTSVGAYLARGGALSEVVNGIMPLAEAVREARAAIENAIERQDYDAAARHRLAEQEAEERFSRAMTAFRSGLQ